MALEDYMEPEVGVAVALTAAVASPTVRGLLRRGAVYGLAGVLMAGDALSALAQGVKRGAQQAADATEAAAPGTAVDEPPAAAPEILSADGGETTPLETAAPKTTPKQTRKAAEAVSHE